MKYEPSAKSISAEFELRTWVADNSFDAEGIALSKEKEPMKAMRTCTAGIVGVALAGLICASRVVGDQTPTPDKVKTFTGNVTSVNEKDRVVSVKSFLFTRTFNGADTCTVSVENKPQASWADLHPGQRVKIHFEDAHGVLVARQIAQRNIYFAGYITALDPAKRILAVKHGVYNRHFTIAEDCSVIVKDDKLGSLDGLRIGHTVNVAYEKEGSSLVTHRIEQRNSTFVGTIRAIDAGTKTVKARDLLNEKIFNLADGCKIVIGGKPDGDLSDLRIGERVVFSYEDANGVLVANRIGRETSSPVAQGVQNAKVKEQ